ncbi:MAG TPA: glycosyltransferase [Tepidisphaeraceae bacterium]|jgi:glycosyltransferase involved in cell wall biosynthesis|nr:glycosyltransferase [Tepidisphaeraceae bacterium]
MKMSGAWESLLDGDPMISCVMPTYGRPDFVSESVAMFLAQDYPRKELVVLNDCAGQELAGEFLGVRLINSKTRFATLGEKRNACIEAAVGPLIAVWDDDDIYLPWRLSLSLREMQRHQTRFYRAAEFWAYWGEASLHDNQSVPGWVNHPNTLFSKTLWQQVGGYPARGVGEDAEFFAKIHESLGQEFIKFPLDRIDRFFVLRGTSEYAHMSMAGGAKPLDLSPGRRIVVPRPIADPVLKSSCDRLIQERYQRKGTLASDGLAPVLSVCVSIKNRSRIAADGRVLELFPNCVRSLSAAAATVGKVELVVADFHSDDWPLAGWLSSAAGNLAHRIIPIDGPFSKGRGLNVAAGAARGSRVLFLDADMLIDRACLERAIEVVDQGRVWLPIFRYLGHDGESAEWEDFSVGNVAFSRCLWNLAKPVPEFQSWGGEDNIFADKLQEHQPPTRERIDGLFHQWHPESCRHAFYSRPARSDYFEYVARQESIRDGENSANLRIK